MLDDRQRLLGLEHPHTLVSRHQLAVATGLGGDRRLARELLGALIPDMRNSLAPDHPQLLKAERSLDTFR
ncbi:hypothetical protein SALBM135S_01669 [Streptomyces alboniger]